MELMPCFSDDVWEVILNWPLLISNLVFQSLSEVVNLGLTLIFKLTQVVAILWLEYLLRVIIYSL